ncbi:MAG: hypothetical protein PHF63_00090 [Herbinix sp.]|nr:hypothetical protein [Herbinix sp.]
MVSKLYNIKNITQDSLLFSVYDFDIYIQKMNFSKIYSNKELAWDYDGDDIIFGYASSPLGTIASTKFDRTSMTDEIQALMNNTRAPHTSTKQTIDRVLI